MAGSENPTGMAAANRQLGIALDVVASYSIIEQDLEKWVFKILNFTPDFQAKGNGNVYTYN